MGMVDDLAQARTDYEQGDWTAALDIWSGVEPPDWVPTTCTAAVTAFLLGRRDASSTSTSAPSGFVEEGRRPGRCAAASTSR